MKIFFGILFLLSANASLPAEVPDVAGEVQAGREYYFGGWFSKAIESYATGWEAGKSATDGPTYAAANDAGTELARMYARLGRRTELQALMQELNKRKFMGAAARRWEDANGSLWSMGTEPEISFLCGPYALANVHEVLHPKSAKIPQAVIDARSNTMGFSFEKVWKLSRTLNMGLQLAKREPGAEVLVPCVVHWKVGHYSALIRNDNGLYISKDPTFIDQIQFSLSALDDQASGYFLVREGPLPKGWKKVNHEEALKIHGKGLASTKEKPVPPCDSVYTADCPVFCSPGNGGSGGGGGGGCDLGGMPQYNFDVMQPALVVIDMPLHGKVQHGPNANLVLRYHSKSTAPEAIASTFGVNWSFGWNAYLQYDGGDPTNNYLEAPGGGRESLFAPYSLAKYSGGAFFTTNVFDSCRNVAGQNINITRSIVRELPSGWKEVYDQPTGVQCYQRVVNVPCQVNNLNQIVNSCSNNGTAPCCELRTFYKWRLFLSQLVDPQGNAITFEYDSIGRINAVVDAAGGRKEFSYPNSSDRHITRVTDPVGRHADFEYDGTGRLTAITDQLGLRSTFAYEHPNLGDFISSMTTPYGTSKFNFMQAALDAGFNPVDNPCGNGSARCLEALDAGGNRERVNDSGHRNLDYWSKKAMHDSPLSLSSNYRYNFAFGGPGMQSNFLSDIVPPLGVAQTQFSYQPLAGTPNGMYRTATSSQAGRSSSYTYTDNGLISSMHDPVGRIFTYMYAPNGQDLLNIKDGLGEVLVSYTYNSQHLPLTMTDAAGQVTSYGYNAFGQLTSIRRPLGDTVDLRYDSTGRLTSITPPDSGLAVAFDYDNMNRIRTSTDASNGTLTYTYDDADRLRRIDYPDGTSDRMDFDKLDLVKMQDRLNRITQLTYDSLRRATSVKDPASRITGFGWCGCGGLETLTDSKGNITGWDYDVLGRVTKRTYADTTHWDYFYDGFGRLFSMKDAKSQVKSYSYFLDDKLSNIDYSPASTAPVSFEYDPVLGRLSKMTDGTGITTFGYNPILAGTLGAGRLSLVDGPLNDDTITYAYDGDGRLKSSAVDGVGENYKFDPYKDELIQVTNPLGDIDYSYDQAGRLAASVAPNGVRTLLSYFPPSGSGYLKQIRHELPGGSVSAKFDYLYNPAGEITNWTQLQNGATKIWDMMAVDAYDPAGQLHKVLVQDGNGSQSQQWDYDLSGNRTQEAIGSRTTSFAPNNLNQLTGIGANKALIEGDTNRAVNTITVNSTPVPGPYTLNQFQKEVPLAAGVNTVEIQGTAADGAVATKRYQIQNPQGLSYDLNGNLISDGNSQYEWDAENRLVRISTLNPGPSNPAKSSEFTYDGMGRRVRILEKQGVQVNADRRFVFDGDDILEERDASNAVVKRFYGDGVQVVSGPQAGTYYYETDHLGSIRNVLNSSGLTVASYDYELWGRQTKLSGTFEADFGYAGYFEHQPSGLALTTYRPYSPSLGTWLSRDPIGEDAGTNLYAYVGGSPVNFSDPLGLMRIEICRNKGTMTLYNDDGSVAMSARAVTGCDPSNTPTGNFTAGNWQQDKTNPQFSGKDGWSKDPWGNPYGPYYLRVNNKNGDYTGTGVHGTRGFGWWPSPTPPFPKGIKPYSHCSHGCTRLSNPDISKLHKMLPNPKGTAIDIKDCP